MFYLPIIGALALASGTIIQKVVLRKKKIGVKTYVSAEFLAIVLAMLPFIYFFWKLDSPAYELKNIFIFLLIVLFSIFANLFNVFSMKSEKVSRLEPAKILEPLFVVLLAIIFSFIFGEVLYERNLNVLIPALIAGAALVFSHIKKHRISFYKFFIAEIFASFFFALELILSRLILDSYSPITFYFLRSLSVFLISLVIFRPQLTRLTKKVQLQFLVLGFVWAIYRVIIYYGYLSLGVVFTTLLFMLGPIFIYLFAWKFLKEKIEMKNIVAALVIILCIAYVILN